MSLELLELDGFSNKITCAIIETPIVEHSGVVYADAALVVDLFQVRVAVQLALAQQSRNLMKTAELDKEILYCLSPSKHINSAMEMFRVTDKTKFALAIFFNVENVQEFLNMHKMNLCALDFQATMDFDRILKCFKITNLEINSKNQETKKASLLNAILSRMAAKEVLK